MKFKEFRKPILESKLGNYSFRLYDGSQTKEFSAIGDFNDNLGCYEICDGNGSIVEYMDLIGNFSKKPTTFAMHFNNYFKTRFFGVRYGVSPYGIYYTSVIDFPSRYFTNKKDYQVEDEVSYEDTYYEFSNINTNNVRNYWMDSTVSFLA